MVLHFKQYDVHYGFCRKTLTIRRGVQRGVAPPPQAWRLLCYCDRRASRGDAGSAETSPELSRVAEEEGLRLPDEARAPRRPVCFCMAIAMRNQGV